MSAFELYLDWNNGQIECLHALHVTTNPVYWCDHIAEVVHKGEDATFLHPNMVVYAPVVPGFDVFAPVEILDPIKSGSALMQMRFQPDVGRTKVIPLGFWNPGEGLMSISNVIRDYIKSEVSPEEHFGRGECPVVTRCPMQAHGVPERRKLASALTLQERWHNWWCIVMEGACVPCIDRFKDMTDDNSGLDTLDKDKPRWK